jgi:hypothetical protein
LDEFKIVVIIAILISMATLGAIIYISQDTINNAKIPDVTRGLVISKAPTSDNSLANYTVNLSDNQVLYILNNSVLYDNIIENRSYVFDCRLDFNNKITFIDNATLIPAPMPTPK